MGVYCEKCEGKCLSVVELVLFVREGILYIEYSIFVGIMGWVMVF